MAYDNVRAHVVLFGGADVVMPLADTWAWDGQEWVQIAEFGPAGRFAAELASAGGTLILHEGARAGTDPQVFADTWEFDGKLWTQRQDIGPGPLQYASMAFDSGLGRVVLFGGNSAPTSDVPGGWKLNRSRRCGLRSPRSPSSSSTETSRRRCIVRHASQCSRALFFAHLRRPT
jgi:hypothetical protein